MKTLVAIILAFGVGFAAAYFIISSQKNAQLEQLKVQPPVTVAAPAPALMKKIVMVPAPAAAASVVESPQEILDELLNLKLGADNSRNADLRLVVFKLETLKQRGAAAVPAIRSFIGRNVDVNYSSPDNNNSDVANAPTTGAIDMRGPNRNIGWSAAPSRGARNLQTLQADWVVPPSLRLGLVSVLKQIGDADSEQALAEC